MEQCPQDLIIMMLLKAFPGYTRQTLLQEPAAFVERMRRFLHKEYLHNK